MVLLEIVLQVGVVVGVMHLLGVLVLLDRPRAKPAFRTVRDNLRAVTLTVCLLLGVLGINKFVRDAGVELSWLIGLNITGAIHDLEGSLVAYLQTLASPALTAYFDFVYVFGYVFLLTFPVVVYALDDGHRRLNVLLTSYAMNYVIGLVCYVLFVAYGPRNFMPGTVEPLLYTSWPESQMLTSQVNSSTNVFPSLHTSLAVTVGLLAYRYRERSPRWFPVATLLAASITVSTMYLGIHWATDVVAGIAVAVASIAAAKRVDDGSYLETVQARIDAAVRSRGRLLLGKLRHYLGRLRAVTSGTS